MMAALVMKATSDNSAEDLMGAHMDAETTETDVVTITMIGNNHSSNHKKRHQHKKRHKHQLKINNVILIITEHQNRYISLLYINTLRFLFPALSLLLIVVRLTLVNYGHDDSAASTNSATTLNG